MLSQRIALSGGPGLELRLRSERSGARSTERLAEPCEHRQVSVKRDSLASANTKRGEAVAALEVSEEAFHGLAASVEVAPEGLAK